MNAFITATYYRDNTDAQVSIFVGNGENMWSVTVGRHANNYKYSC